MEEKKKVEKKSKVPLIIFILLLVGAVSGGFYYYYQNQLQQEMEKEQKMMELEYLGSVTEKKIEAVAAITEEQKQQESIRNQLISGNLDPNLKVAFLTFDDGPNTGSTEVLDTLARYGVKATFFTNMRTGPEYEAIYRRYISDGHVLANHTVDHNYQLYKNPPAFYQNITDLENYLRTVTGVEPVKLFRFPGGSNMTNTSVINGVVSMGYNFCDWDADAGDGTAHPLPPDQVIAKIVGECSKLQTPIILMHAENPYKPTSRQALPGLIEALRAQGYIFMTLDPAYSHMAQFVEPTI